MNLTQEWFPERLTLGIWSGSTDCNMRLGPNGRAVLAWLGCFHNRSATCNAIAKGCFISWETADKALTELEALDLVSKTGDAYQFKEPPDATKRLFRTRRGKHADWRSSLAFFRCLYPFGSLRWDDTLTLGQLYTMAAMKGSTSFTNTISGLAALVGVSRQSQTRTLETLVGAGLVYVEISGQEASFTLQEPSADLLEACPSYVPKVRVLQPKTKPQIVRSEEINEDEPLTIRPIYDDYISMDDRLTQREIDENREALRRDFGFREIRKADWEAEYTVGLDRDSQETFKRLRGAHVERETAARAATAVHQQYIDKDVVWSLYQQARAKHRAENFRGTCSALFRGYLNNELESDPMGARFPSGAEVVADEIRKREQFAARMKEEGKMPAEDYDLFILKLKSLIGVPKLAVSDETRMTLYKAGSWAAGVCRKHNWPADAAELANAAVASCVITPKQLDDFVKATAKDFEERQVLDKVRPTVLRQRFERLLISDPNKIKEHIKEGEAWKDDQIHKFLTATS